LALHFSAGIWNFFFLLLLQHYHKEIWAIQNSLMKDIRIFKIHKFKVISSSILDYM